MDLQTRVKRHFEDSAQTKLKAAETLSAPVAAAIDTMEIGRAHV